jgi:hypothetical protein
MKQRSIVSNRAAGLLLQHQHQRQRDGDMLLLRQHNKALVEFNMAAKGILQIGLEQLDEVGGALHRRNGIANECDDRIDRHEVEDSKRSKTSFDVDRYVMLCHVILVFASAIIWSPEITT